MTAPEWTRIGLTFAFLIFMCSFFYIDSKKTNKRNEKRDEEHKGAMSFLKSERRILCNDQRQDSPFFEKNISFILGYLKQSEKCGHEISNERLIEILILIMEEIEAKK